MQLFNLKDILKTTSEIVNSALVVIEGESRSPDEAIEAIGKQKKDKKNDSESEEKMLQVGLYVPCVRNSRFYFLIQILDCLNLLFNPFIHYCSRRILVPIQKSFRAARRCD